MIFAKEGLRTLCMAKKKISEDDVEVYLEEFKEINSSSSKDKNQELFNLYNKIEKDFNFVGASAIEDKLQDVIFNKIKYLTNILLIINRAFLKRLRFY